MYIYIYTYALILNVCSRGNRFTGYGVLPYLKILHPRLALKMVYTRLANYYRANIYTSSRTGILYNKRVWTGICVFINTNK